jgi:predicted Rossmann fold flavoprotein
MPYDAIILGGGAAGLFCAAIAGQRGLKVAVLERSDQVGRKILISGGGRCNFTNLGAGPEQYLSANPHFAKSALRRYTPRDFLELVERHGIAWHEKTLGQLFCDERASQIVDMLLAECARGDVTVLTGQDVGQIVREDAGDGTNARFALISNGTVMTADRLVIATGGPSIPKMGASDFAYRIARQFGLKVVEPRPALVPLVLGGDDTLFRELSGVSTQVLAHAGSGKRTVPFREAALLTHRGLSGPAILQVSSYWKHGEPVTIDFLPDHSAGYLVDRKRASPNADIASALKDVLPERLARVLADRISQPGAMQGLSDKVLRQAGERLKKWQFHPGGTEGFAKAEVTAGGIATSELSSATMESRKVPGLYAIGEAVDVTGWLGGYNFQWAWASGVAAGSAM